MFTAILHFVALSMVSGQRQLPDWTSTRIVTAFYLNNPTFQDPDYFFDRLVIITLDGCNNCSRPFRNIVTGVLIDSHRILTSYNPFRSLIHSEEMKSRALVTVVVGRYKRAQEMYCLPRMKYYFVDCGRQVAYLPDHRIKDKQWIGPDKKHSPVHDLMVLRIAGNITKWNTMTPNEYNFDKMCPKSDSEMNKDLGSLLTDLATPGDRLDRTVKYCSFDFRSDSAIKFYNRLRAVYYDANDNVIVNCDEWLPREWGYFICILNIDNHPALVSSAMLFSNNKLYGVGSFALYRNEQSILVFTDVRPYYELIVNTCTLEDTS